MHRKRYITNTVFFFGTGLFAQLITLFVLPLFIKNLGKEMYGLFVISNLLTGYVGLLDFGFTDGLTREVGRTYSTGNREALEDAVATGFWLLAAVGMTAGALIYFGRFGILDFLNVTGADRKIAANLLTLTALFSVIKWPLRLPQVILRAALRIKEESIIRAAGTLVSSVTMLALVYFAFDVVTVRFGVFLVGTLTALAEVALARHYVPEAVWHPLRFRRGTFRNMSGFSLGMFYSKLLSFLGGRVDQLIIGNMIGLGSITAYSVADKMHRFLQVSASRLSGPVLPTIFSLDTIENRHKLQTFLTDSVRYRVLLISPLAYVGIIVSPTFIRIWMGPEYEKYAIWSQLLMVLCLAGFLGMATSLARGTGRLRISNGIHTAGVTTKLVAAIALTPVFGIGGPIIGSLVSVLLFGIIPFPFLCRLCRVDWRPSLLQAISILGANAPAAVLCLLLIRAAEIQSWAVLVLVCGLIAALFYSTLFILFVRARERSDIRMAVESTGLTRVPVVASIVDKILAPS